MEYTTSKLCLLVSITSLYYFIMVMYYVSFHSVRNLKKLRGYEHFMMVAQINMSFQIISLVLHILGYFSSKHRKVRDFVFVNLAFPFSISTMATFWIFWLLVGEKQVFPQDLTIVHPLWVTHGFHTLSPAINIVLLYAIKHDYNPNPFTFSYCFVAVYLFGACSMYVFTGNFRKAYIEKLTRNQTGFYYSALVILSHLCYLGGYVYDDLCSAEKEYEAIVAARLTEAEREINAAPTPISRTPTPLLIIPRDTPTLKLPTATEEERDVSPEITVPSAYRPRAPARPSTPPSPRPFASRSSVGRRRKADKKNN